MWLVMSAGAGALGGFLSLCLAMDRHHEDAYGRGTTPGRRRPWLRAAGAAMLVLSLGASLGLQGPTRGWVLWFGMLTAAALAAAGIASYAPRRAARIGMAAALLAVACLAPGLLIAA
ncbi:DUF3325 domain-containing protein [Variovorax saccharolyticus]|uniref:DUF3325 domain-containing protein n=1 Tax=Variovorax saccharolyticus TaxID=3053516 RepID=UPI0025761299|nr:DUF3325 domain-containing protein [Variovorax sp. J31P216]MDM0028092.1 DUF3325 domain-containing protein [Variovorax sp. J31P216]